MKNTLKLGILFVILSIIFFTIPTLKRIHQYRLTGAIEVGRKIELPNFDSYELNAEIEGLIEKTQLEKKNMYSQRVDAALLKIYEYELVLQGDMPSQIDFVDKIARMDGAKIRTVRYSSAEGERGVISGSRVRMEIRIAFIGGEE